MQSLREGRILALAARPAYPLVDALKAGSFLAVICIPTLAEV